MNNNSGGNFFNGIILGLIIGGGAALLFSTKKGKKILKTITEEGLQLSELLDRENLEDKFEEVRDLYEEKLGKKCCGEKNCKSHSKKTEEKAEDEIVENKEIKKEESISQTNGLSNGQAIANVVKKTHRFFKGIPKKR